MKWINKGHEFDELGAIFQKNNTLVLIGKQSENKVLGKKLEFLNVAVERVDTDFGSDLKVRSSKNRAVNLFCRVLNKMQRIKSYAEFMGGGGA
jgi:hypothetical protein